MNCEGPKCQEALRKLHLFIDHEIETADHDEIEAHLHECGECLDEFAVERFVKALIGRSCRETAPEVLRERVLMSIRTVQVEITELRD